MISHPAREETVSEFDMSRFDILAAHVITDVIEIADPAIFTAKMCHKKLTKAQARHQPS